MAIKYTMHSSDYDMLKEMLPENGLPHKCLEDSRQYRRTSYDNMVNFLKTMGLSIVINFGYSSRRDNFIEVDHGKGATISYQFFRGSSDTIKGTLTKLSDKNNSKQSDVDTNDPEFKYRKNNTNSQQRDSPKTIYNPFTKKTDTLPSDNNINYNEWQDDDDLPF